MNSVKRLLSSVGNDGAPPPEQPLGSVTIVPPGKPTWIPQLPPDFTPPDPQQPTPGLFLNKQKQQPRLPTSLPPTPPLNGPRDRSLPSPRTPPPRSSPFAPSRIIPRKSVFQDGDSKRNSGSLNTRDELLISLLASEALVDSRDFEILSAEEVEELKKEEQVLLARLGAQEKRLSMETKIRDAALTLSRVNSSHKKMSKQTEEQLGAANQRVDAAQKEFWRLSEKTNEIQKRLLQHRAGVLSFSVRRIDRKSTMSNPTSGHDSGYTTPSNGAPFSPTSTTTSLSSASKFDGAHFFAGHVDSIVPRRKQTPSMAAAEITSLEDKLKAATDALNTASKKQVEMARELSLLQLEKQEVETMMGMELQSAEETINALEAEIPRFEQLDADLQTLQEEKGQWEYDRQKLLEQLEEAQHASNDQSAVEHVQNDLQRELEEKGSQILALRSQFVTEQERWDKERRHLEERNQEDTSRLNQEMKIARQEDSIMIQKLNEELGETEVQLKGLIQSRGLLVQDSSLPGLLSTIASHVHLLEAKTTALTKAQGEWDALRKKLETDVRDGLDRRDSMARELEQARHDREQARKEVHHLKDENGRIMSMSSNSNFSPAPVQANLPPIDSTDPEKIISALQPIWAILPSVEARAARAAKARNFRTGSPTTPNSPKAPPSSLSELDVRSLKILYEDARNPLQSPNSTPFTVEGFIARVQALIVDDKALIERLIRFAQAHDMLKKNAERAQKLAQESNIALETYQKQVRALEERNLGLSTNHADLQNEAQDLQETINRLTAEKLEVESLAAEQAETCAQLTEANNTLSARALALAEEAATAPEMVKRQLEAQLSETRASLKEAQEHIDAMRTAEQSQSMALLDELNSMQTENGNLKAQLRALKK